MDLFACSKCGDQFYVPGVGSSDRRGCPHCGGGLNLALHDVASIPLDARWLDPDRPAAPTVAAKTIAAHPIGAG
jgi:predicted  nucleic acid-binding Zn-ribbon protein